VQRSTESNFRVDLPQRTTFTDTAALGPNTAMTASTSANNVQAGGCAWEEGDDSEMMIDMVVKRR
jgi:hypothetical protein